MTERELWVEFDGIELGIKAQMEPTTDDCPGGLHWEFDGEYSFDLGTPHIIEAWLDQTSGWQRIVEYAQDHVTDEQVKEAYDNAD